MPAQEGGVAAALALMGKCTKWATITIIVAVWPVAEGSQANAIDIVGRGHNTKCSVLLHQVMMRHVMHRHPLRMEQPAPAPPISHLAQAASRHATQGSGYRVYQAALQGTSLQPSAIHHQVAFWVSSGLCFMD